MGLDMYLYRKTYVKNWDHMKKEATHQIGVKLNKKKHPIINLKKITYIVEEIGYWRKANAIHKWFVDNVQNGNDDCGCYDVTIEEIKELYETCKSVIKDPELAKSELPTGAGFFFGATEYDEWYFQSLQNTVDVLEPLFNDEQIAEEFVEKGAHIYPDYEYQSSW